MFCVYWVCCVRLYLTTQTALLGVWSPPNEVIHFVLLHIYFVLILFWYLNIRWHVENKQIKLLMLKIHYFTFECILNVVGATQGWGYTRLDVLPFVLTPVLFWLLFINLKLGLLDENISLYTKNYNILTIWHSNFLIALKIAWNCLNTYQYGTDKVGLKMGKNEDENWAAVMPVLIFLFQHTIWQPCESTRV